MNHIRGASLSWHRALTLRLVYAVQRTWPTRHSNSVAGDRHCTIPAVPLDGWSVRCYAVPTTKFNTKRTPLLSDGKQSTHQAAPNVARLIEELRVDIAVRRRVLPEKLNRVLDRPSEIPPAAYELLLGCCGKLLTGEPIALRMKLFERVWGLVGEKKQLGHWKALLKVYRENRVPIENVSKLLHSIGETCGPEVLVDVLAILAERGDVKAMQEVMQILQERQVAMSPSMANLLIRGYGYQQDMSGVQMVLETMNASNVPANGDTHGELIVAFLRANVPDRVAKLIKEKGSTLPEERRLEILKLALEKSEGETVKAIVRLLPPEMLSDVSIDPTIRNLLIEFVEDRCYDAVLTFLKLLPAPNFRANENTDAYGKFLIVEMLKNGAPAQDLLQLTEFLISSERNSRALHVACECAIKDNHPMLSQLLVSLAAVENLRPHYFWPLIIQRHRSDGEVGVLSVLKFMQRLKVHPDIETISVFLLPKLTVTIKDCRAALKIFEDRGVQISRLMTPFVSHLLYQNRFADVLTIVNLYPTKLDTESLLWPLILQANVNRTLVHYRTLCEVIRALKDKAIEPRHDLGGQLLLELVSNKKSRPDNQSVKLLLQELDKFGVRISRMATNMLKKHFVRSKSDAVNEQIDSLLRSLVDEQLTTLSKEVFETISVHPRDMNYDELECHLTELEEKKMNCRGVLRRLLQLCVRENRLERAQELKARCDAAMVEPSSGMMASVLELYTKTNRSDLAGRTLERLRKEFPGFQIDEHKIIDYAALLVEQGQLTNVKKILEQRAATGQLRPSSGYGKNLWNLLTKCAQWSVTAQPESTTNATLELLDFLVQLGYCSYDNNLLGPAIREHLLRNQKLAAVNLFKRMATEKRRTPLQLEIVTLLVGLTNANDMNISPEEAKALLDEIIQLVSKVHGSVNTNNTLIVALAESGTETQLRRILINPETRVNLDHILTQCEFLLNSGKLDVVLRLAKGCRGLANVKETDFLSLILQHYVRHNDCDAAIELFNRMTSDEDAFKVTGDFARRLVNLLEVNNYEVPSNVLLHVK